MFENIKPGQSITVTVTSVPRTDDRKSTIERLMRRDIAAKRGLRKSARMRRQNMIVYNRGNRDWYKRELCSKIVHLAKGASWSMLYTPDLANDFAAVSKYLSVKAG